MTNFQSLAARLHLKGLLSALRKAHTSAPLPFYILRIDHSPLSLPPHCALSLSQRISNETLSRFEGALSIWSPHHLHRIAETMVSRRRIILKNPFKSAELIKESVEGGVTEMLVNSEQQIERIRSVLGQNPVQKKLCYHWMIEENHPTLQVLEEISSSIRGLFFSKEIAQDVTNVERITQAVLARGHHIEHIICETEIESASAVLQWQKRPVYCGKTHVQKTVDICDYSEVGQFIMATKNNCKERLMIREEARNLVWGIDAEKESLLVEDEGEQWLLAAISELPLQESRFMFHLERQPRREQVGGGRALAL